LPAGERKRIIRLGQNELIPLARGWHTVRNVSTQEPAQASRSRDENGNDMEALNKKRDKIEAEFLKTGEWAVVPDADKGIEFLRQKKLSTLLVEHIKSNLPQLIRSASNLKRRRTAERETLGEPRSTGRDQLRFITPMAEEFTRLAHAAVAGVYSDDFFGQLGDRSQRSQDTRLRANITEMSLLFGNVMVECGRRVFVPYPESTSIMPRDYDLESSSSGGQTLSRRRSLNLNEAEDNEPYDESRPSRPQPRAAEDARLRRRNHGRCLHLRL
jgi:hypothetical protein